jgi:hypothetical protein
VVNGRDGPIPTVGTDVATAHRGLAYSVTGVSDRKVRRRVTAAIHRRCGQQQMAPALRGTRVGHIGAHRVEDTEQVGFPRGRI